MTATIEITLDLSNEAMGVEDWNGYDEEATLDNYRDEVRKAIETAYPEADVQVYEGGYYTGQIIDIDDENSEDEINTNHIRGIIDHVFNAQDWYVEAAE